MPKILLIAFSLPYCLKSVNTLQQLSVPNFIKSHYSNWLNGNKVADPTYLLLVPFYLPEVIHISEYQQLFPNHSYHTCYT